MDLRLDNSRLAKRLSIKIFFGKYLNNFEEYIDLVASNNLE